MATATTLIATRKYFPAWEQLKREKKIVVAARREFHARILKAIIKEKDMDVTFKLELSEDCRRARISHTTNGPALTIVLSFSTGTSDWSK